MRASTSRSALFLILLVGTAAPAWAQDELFHLSRTERREMLPGAVRVIAYTRDGGRLAVAGDGPRAFVLSAGDTIAPDTAPVGAKRALSLAWNREGRRLVIGTDGDGLRLWDDSARTLRPFGPRSGSMGSVAWSPNDDEIAAADGKTVDRLATATGDVLARLRGGHSKPVLVVGYLGQGDALLSVGQDRRMIVWDAKTGAQIRRSEEPDPDLKAATMSLDGDRLLLGTEDTELPGFRGGQGVNRLGLVYMDRLKIYDPSTGSMEKTIDHLLAAPTCLSLSPDGRLMAVGQHDTRRDFVSIWDVERGIEVAEEPADRPVTAVAWSPDGGWLAWGDVDGAVTLNRVTGVQPTLAYTADLRGRKFVITSARTPLIVPNGRLRMAVLKLDNVGVDSGVALSVSDQIVNRLAADPIIRLVERQRIAAILGEQAFQHSGRTDPAFAVRVGRILNIDKLLLGSVARLGSAITIDVELVDVQSGRIDGVRELQCQNCGLEDLPRAVGELSGALVSPWDVERAPVYPEPPQIDIVAPVDGAEVTTASVTLEGRVTYSAALQGVELIVNGKPYAASRLFDAPDSGRLTRLGNGRTEFSFVQSLPLEPGNNVLAIRALGDDNNDQQRYVFVRRTVPPPAPAATAPKRAPVPEGPPPLTLA
ncbi:MAG: CsgG/HfaB family protein, partial [Gemmatimonadales bacterium]